GAGAGRLPDAGHGARDQPRRPVAAPLRRLPGPARAPRPLRPRGRLPDGTPGRLTPSPLPPAPLPEAGRGEQERSFSPLLRFGGEGPGVRGLVAEFFSTVAFLELCLWHPVPTERTPPIIPSLPPPLAVTFRADRGRARGRKHSPHPGDFRWTRPAACRP